MPYTEDDSLDRENRFYRDHFFPENESDDCNSTAACPASDSHYKGCPVLDSPKGIGVEY